MAYTQGGSVFPAGFQRISDEPRQIFYDPFDASPDTTNLWTSTTGNSGVAAAVTAGVLSLGTGTVANGFSKIISIPTFKPVVPAWLGNSFAIALPDGAAPIANSYRFWGLFSSPASPTTIAPLTDAIGFELTTAGKLQLVVWAAGVRTLIADLSSSGTNKQPLDTAYHRYIVYYRTDRAYFYIDGIGDAQLVGSTSFQSPSVQTLATGLLTIGAATPPASNTQIQSTGLAVWDTGKNVTQLADGTFPFRKVKIGKNSGINVSGAVITGTSGAIAAAGTGTIGPLDVSEAGNVTFTVKNTVAASAWAGTPVLVFEQSDDNVSWAPLNTTRTDTGATSGTHSLVAGSASTSLMFDAALEGVGYVRCRVTTGPTTNGLTVVISSGGMPFSPSVSVVNNPSRYTYRASTAAVLVAVSGTAPFFVIYGSASKIIKVQSITISGLTAGNNSFIYTNINVAKYSTAPAAGTATALTKVPLDSANPAATASLVQVYTAAPTAGTKVGDIFGRRILMQSSTAATGTPLYDAKASCTFDSIQSAVLRGTAEGLACYFTVAPGQTGNMMVDVEWTEE